MEKRKLVHAFRRKASRNTISFQQQDEHTILLSLPPSSAVSIHHICKIAVMRYMPKKTRIILYVLYHV